MVSMLLIEQELVPLGNGIPPRGRTPVLGLSLLGMVADRKKPLITQELSLGWTHWYYVRS